MRRKTITEFIVIAIIAILLTIPLRFYVARPFIVSGASMLPTFDAKEYLVIDELSYRFKKPQRGDIIVMRYPLDESKFFIKRIVGLPGEVVSVRDGEVSILGNGDKTNVTLTEPYRAAVSRHDFQVTSLSNTEYYVLGDNRDESSDSRAWGPLQEKYIVGRVLARLYPFNEVGLFPGKYSL